jgi:glucokinase
MILAGDIGGTNARLAFFDFLDGRFNLVSASIFPSRDYSGLDKIVTEFVDSSHVHPQTACFGVAGPVRDGKVETSNLPWIVESKRLADELKIEKAVLINDLEATAWGIAALAAKDVVSLNRIKEPAVGNQAVIAAGTGLGEAGLYWDGARHHIFATEGGHTDFGPRNDLEVELFCYLHKRFGHVSSERILSGPGLVNVYTFLRDTRRGSEQQWLLDEMAHNDPAAAISRAGLGGKDTLSEQALDIFVSVYGAEAGNLALKTKATGGLYVAGGIAPKLLPKLTTPSFMNAFFDKGRMRPLMESMPVHIITNDKLALLGAARCAVTPAA